jgi:hypothetical protein
MGYPEVDLEKIIHGGVLQVGIELAGLHMVRLLYWELKLTSVNRDVVRESSHDTRRHEVRCKLKKQYTTNNLTIHLTFTLLVDAPGKLQERL